SSDMDRVTANAYDTSIERSKTEDIIRHIKNLIDEASLKNINIKALVFDSAGEYTAAQHHL
ncbi:35741_t:CDS:2, partial [Racocetra persica]